MSTRRATFKYTNPSAYNGKAAVYTLEEMAKFPKPTWLIDTLVPNSVMVGLCGPPGVGKSLLAIDWALSVATGQPWAGHAVQKGFALYVAAEGHSGLFSRAQAWLTHRNIPMGRANFGLVKGRLSVRKEGPDTHDEQNEYDTLFTRLKEEINYSPTLVVIDTLARCIDGDENDSLGMTSFLDGAERFIEQYGSTVVVIHHKNAAGTRERGHTAFRGALGAMFFIERHPKQPGLLVLKNEKQRDAREAADLGLAMTEDGDSARLEAAPLPAKAARETGMPKIPDTQSMLSWLGGQEDGATHREWMLGARVPKAMFNRRLHKLTLANEIYKGENGRYHVMPSIEDIAEDGDAE